MSDSSKRQREDGDEENCQSESSPLRLSAKKPGVQLEDVLSIGDGFMEELNNSTLSAAVRKEAIAVLNSALVSGKRVAGNTPGCILIGMNGFYVVKDVMRVRYAAVVYQNKSGHGSLMRVSIRLQDRLSYVTATFKSLLNQICASYVGLVPTMAGGTYAFDRCIDGDPTLERGATRRNGVVMLDFSGLSVAESYAKLHFYERNVSANGFGVLHIWIMKGKSVELNTPEAILAEQPSRFVTCQLNSRIDAVYRNYQKAAEALDDQVCGPHCDEYVMFVNVLSKRKLAGQATFLELSNTGFAGMYASTSPVRVIMDDYPAIVSAFRLELTKERSSAPDPGASAPSFL